MPLAKTVRSWMGPTALYLAGGTVGLAPLLIGGVSPTASVVLAALALLTLLLHTIERHRAGRPVTVSWATAALALPVLATCVSLLPLPAGLRALLDPRSAELKTFVADGLPDGSPPLLSVLAVDPPESALALVRLLTAVAVFIVIADRGRRRRARNNVWAVLVGAGALVLLVSAFHRLANLDRIYGLVELHADTPLRGPLVNPNHLARIFGGYALLAFAFAAHVRDRRQQGGVLAVATLLSSAVVATLSVGGALAFGATILCGLAGWWLARSAPETDNAARGRHSLALLVGAVVVGAAVWLVQDAANEALSAINDDQTGSKADLYRAALHVVPAHPWVGVGPGGFRTAFPSNVPIGELSGLRYTHVENVVLETLASHGVPLGAGVLAIGGVTAWHLLRRLPMPALRAPLLVVIFLALGDLFDFVLQIPAGLLLMTAALAIVTGMTLERGGPAWSLAPRRALVGWLVCAVVVTAASVLAVAEARDRFDRDLTEASGPKRLQVLRAAIAAHPLDPWYAYLAAVEARQQKDASQAMSWANRAIVLDPNNGAAHVEAARVLWADGQREQALSEYRQAWLATRHNANGLIEEVAKRTALVETRLAAVPERERQGRVGTCKRIHQEKRKVSALKCWQIVLKDFPDDKGIRRWTARASLLAAEAEAVPMLLEPLLGEDSLSGSDAKLLVAAHANTSSLEAAFDEALRLRPRISTERFEFEWWVLGAARRLRRFSEAQQSLQLARQGATRKQRVELDAMEAKLLEEMGNVGEALIRWQKIGKASPSNHAPLLEVMRLQLSLRMFPEAELTLQKLRRRAQMSPSDARLKTLVTKAEERLRVARDAPVRQRQAPTEPTSP